MNDLAAQVSRMDVFVDKLIDFCTSAGIRILLALVIFIVGKFIIGKLMKVIDKLQSKSPMDATANNYIKSIIKAVLYIVLVVAIIGELGVPMASVITVLASAGVAVGMAMQGSLGNLAGGMLLAVIYHLTGLCTGPVGEFIVSAAGAKISYDRYS